MKRNTSTLKSPTRLEAAARLVYVYRHEIAYGLMVVATLLKSWNPIMEMAPTTKTAKAKVVRSRSTRKKST